MANKYILNPDGSIQKYKEDASQELEGKIYPDKLTDDDESSYLSDLPAAKQLNNTIYDGVQADIDFGSLSDDADSGHKKIISNIENDKSFGFIDTDGNVKDTPGKISSYTPFNSYSEVNEKDEKIKTVVFADELEMLGGIRLDADALDISGKLLGALFSYFAESILRIVLVEVIVIANKAFVAANGSQTSTFERYSLRIGRYDFTEFDLFSRYVFNVLNYPHESSGTVQRILAYFAGFTQWLAPDMLIDFDEILKETKKQNNKLEFAVSAFDPNWAKALMVIAESLVSIGLAALSNQTVNNRANLLFRKFYQERHWNQEILYKAKEKEAAVPDLFTDLNYYYFKFYIERIQIGLKYINKYVYKYTYLRDNAIDSPFNRVSGNKSNKNIDAAIELMTFDGKALTGDIAEILTQGEYKPEKSTVKPTAVAAAAAAAAAIGLDAPADASSRSQQAIKSYSWLYKDSDGEKTDDEISIAKGKKPGQSTRIRALPQMFSMHPSLYRALAANGKTDIKLGKDLMQNFYTLSDDEKRIPDYAVTEIENALEAEYMPFYLHDIRTNEILSFHAFIESITDSFNPEYNSSSGFGRIDDVRTYVKTTRNINVSFTLASTSESDHDLMWYQINKIVAMVYPQWSDGFNVLERKEGEVVFDKSGNPKIDFKYPFTQVPNASPLVRLRVGDVIKSNYSRTNLSRLHGVGERQADLGAEKALDASNRHYELLPGNYKVDQGGSDILGLTLSFGKRPMMVTIDSPVKIAELIDSAADETIEVYADASKIVASQIHKLSKGGAADDLMKPMKDGKVNNPITKSYESGMSRGLAGFITQLDVNYNEVPWETSRVGSKAPMLVKLTINFAPIHDIPPGLDHNGMLRAPVYNVGRINNEFFGDPKDHTYTGSGRDLAMAKYKFLKYKEGSGN